MLLPKAGAMDALADFLWNKRGEVNPVSFTRISAAALIGLALLSLAGCGNTIRGIGRDVGNAVDATQDAGRSVAHSVD